MLLGTYPSHRYLSPFQAVQHEAEEKPDQIRRDSNIGLAVDVIATKTFIL